MSTKTTVCPIKEPQALAMIDKNTGKSKPAGVCPGDYIPIGPFEGVTFLVNGVKYGTIEQCQKCGNILPG